jgi:aspartate aminotransferase
MGVHMFSQRMNGIELSGIRKMFDLADKNSINLGLGEPDFQPPEEAIEAVHSAMKMGFNKYGPTNGIPDLRKAIALRLGKYWKNVGAENVVVTSSGSEALFSSSMTFIDPGNSVLIPDPGFVLYRPHVHLTGGRGVAYPLTIENDFRPDVEEMERLADDSTKVLIVNSPNNPTGGMISRQDRDDLVDFARDRDIIIISDEVYDSMTYTGSVHHSFLGKYENAVMVNSFSKIFSMTGWRMGYMAAETELISKLSLAHYHMVACPPTPIQYGALEALKTSDRYIQIMVNEYESRRDLIIRRLNAIDGFRVISPRGTFYSFPTFDRNDGSVRLNSVDMATELAKEGLICSPGTAFGGRGEYHLRFSFVNSRDKIDMGMDILEKVSRRFRS